MARLFLGIKLFTSYPLLHYPARLCLVDFYYQVVVYRQDPRPADGEEAERHVGGHWVVFVNPFRSEFGGASQAGFPFIGKRKKSQR